MDVHNIFPREGEGEVFSVSTGKKICKKGLQSIQRPPKQTFQNQEGKLPCYPFLTPLPVIRPLVIKLTISDIVKLTSPAQVLTDSLCLEK